MAHSRSGKMISSKNIDTYVVVGFLTEKKRPVFFLSKQIIENIVHSFLRIPRMTYFLPIKIAHLIYYFNLEFFSPFKIHYSHKQKYDFVLAGFIFSK